MMVDPGWDLNPDGTPTLSYHDGAQWTGHVQDDGTVGRASQEEQPAEAGNVRSGRALRALRITLGALPGVILGIAAILASIVLGIGAILVLTIPGLAPGLIHNTAEEITVSMKSDAEDLALLLDGGDTDIFVYPEPVTEPTNGFAYQVDPLLLAPGNLATVKYKSSIAFCITVTHEYEGDEAVPPVFWISNAGGLQSEGTEGCDALYR